MNLKQKCYPAALLSVILLTTACSNAITFHQSERNSISLELRATDPNQPLQGTIGIKNRTIVVAPGKDNAVLPGTSASGEATSVVSDFYFDRTPGKGASFGKTTVRSAFITGDAAVAVPKQSIEAISGIGTGPISDLTVVRAQTLASIVDQLKLLRGEGDSVALGHLAALDALAAKLPSNISTQTYYNFSANNLNEVTGIQIRSGFEGAMDYEAGLRTSLTAIVQIESDRRYTLSNNPISPTQMTEILQAKKRIEDERKAFFEEIGNNTAIDVAAAYVISKL